MASQSNLKVLDLGPREVELDPHARRLLEELAVALHLPPQYVLQLALTHTLSSVQRRQSIHMTLPFEPVADHKPDPSDG